MDDELQIHINIIFVCNSTTADVPTLYALVHLNLNFTPKQRNSDYLLHGRREIGGSVGTASFFY